MQGSSYIDLTRGFRVGDSQTFMPTMLTTNREDSPEETPKVVAFEGYNFLPTDYGHKSFFGTQVTMEVTPLPVRADYIFNIQTDMYENILVALTENGIWTIRAGTAEWVREVELPPAVGEQPVPQPTISPTVIEYYVSPGLQTCEELATLPPFPPPYQTNNYGCIPGDTALAQYLALQPAEHNIVKLLGDNMVPGHYWETAGVVISEDDGTASFFPHPPPIGYIYDEATRTFIPDPEAVTPEEAIYLEWTYVVVRQQIFMYRQNHTHVFTISARTDWQFESFTSTFLNMPAQMGIFKADNRLAIWDSANAIAFSSVDNLQDFVPSLETLAGITTFDSVLGNIVTIKSLGNGFVIYATKSIVWVSRDVGSTMGFKVINSMHNSGIAYRKEAVSMVPDSTHFCITNSGLHVITEQGPTPIAPDVIDFLKEPRDPIYLSCMQGRYLVLHVMNEEYVLGYPDLERIRVDPFTITWDRVADPGSTISGMNDQIDHCWYQSVVENSATDWHQTLGAELFGEEIAGG